MMTIHPDYYGMVVADLKAKLAMVDNAIAILESLRPPPPAPPDGVCEIDVSRSPTMRAILERHLRSKPAASDPA